MLYIWPKIFFVPEPRHHFLDFCQNLFYINKQKYFYSPDTTRPEVDKHIVKKVPVKELHSETGTIYVEIWNRNCLSENLKKKVKSIVEIKSKMKRARTKSKIGNENKKSQEYVTMWLCVPIRVIPLNGLKGCSILEEGTQ